MVTQLNMLLQTLMGIFFYTHSVALVEDIHLEHDVYGNETELISDMEKGFQQVSMSPICAIRFCNCLVAREQRGK